MARAIWRAARTSPPGSVKDQVDWDVRVGHVDGAEHLLRVVDVDVAEDGEAQQAHRLLTVDQQDDPRAALPLDLRDQPLARGVEVALLDDRLQRRDDEEQPEDVEHAHLSFGLHPRAFDAVLIRLQAPDTRRGRTNKGWRSNPAAKPPTCAHQATPATSAGPARAIAPLKSWLRAQNSRYVTAGTSKNSG